MTIVTCDCGCVDVVVARVFFPGDDSVLVGQLSRWSDCGSDDRGTNWDHEDATPTSLQGLGVELTQEDLEVEFGEVVLHVERSCQMGEKLLSSRSIIVDDFTELTRVTSKDDSCHG
jgi:hypothetical protein